MEPNRANVTPLRGVGRPRGDVLPSEAERLTEASSVLLASADRDLRLIFLNGAWERMLGWLPEELAGSVILDLLHADDLERTALAFAAARGKGLVEIDLEVRVTTRHGQWRWFAWNFRFEGGRWYGAGQDTTERRAQERELAAGRERLAEVQRIAGIGGFDLDVVRGRLWWSDEHYRIYGVAAETYLPTVEGNLEFVHPDDAERVRSAWLGLTGGGEDRRGASCEIDFRIVRPDGAVRELTVHANVTADEAGMPVRVAGTVQDVTERGRAERALSTEQAKLRALVDQVPAIVYTAGFGAEGRWDYVSPQIETMLGYTAEDWASDPKLWWDALHPEDRKLALEDEDGAAEPGGRLRSEYRLRRRDGGWIWVRDEATVIENEDGELCFQGVLLDITAAKHAEEALGRSEAKYRDLVETSHDLIWSVDAQGCFTFVNDAAKAIYGYEPEDMLGRPFVDFETPESADADLEVFTSVLRGAAVVGHETRHLRQDGKPVDLSFNAVALRDGRGMVTGTTGTARDITEQNRSRHALERHHAQLQAIIDNSPLVIWAKDRAGRYLFSNGLHNNLYGVDKSEIIGLRDADFLSLDHARKFASSDRKVFETGEPMELEQQMAVGGRNRTFIIHKFPLRDPSGDVYGVCGIASDITERKEREDALRSKVEWSFRIRNAIERDRLVLYSQPIIEIAGGRVVQEELLLRMRGDDGELILPGKFLPPAERFDLAPAIDRWVIARATLLARERRVEVNLSGQSMGERWLLDYIEEQLKQTGADPSNLVFEITETAAAEDLDQARRLADRLADVGCGFALDDFGTGYGSFTYLKYLPVSYIKVDTEFVRDLRADSPDRQVVSAIVDVARNFGIETIAEGVESNATLEFLEALGVDYAQGFHIGQPTEVKPG
jgi:PAS domain S-box-containing protein